MNTLSKTRSIMSKFNIVANKRYGQNFLIDDNILQGIVSAADITDEDLVIEIGPGLGNLTEYILNTAKYGLLVEIDPKMIAVLEDRFKDKTNYTLLNEDILKVDIDNLVEKIKTENNIDFKSVKVVANLPYYITTPIIFQLLEDSNCIESITVMVQKEVAERMTADSHSKEYGILTIMVDYFSNANIDIIVPNSSFIPEPGVTSAVITLKKNRKYKVNNEKVFFELVHKAFAQRRKKMTNSLSSNNFNNMSKQEIEELFTNCNLKLTTRAEELETIDFINIANSIK
ncbi:MAG: 16S rRNA (adenine(1518)-N(6)/adenine(1519)-N(6))-dimethyltransferase RsmA [Clostridia bacterium]|nr:16S rRNA (adenine(1518)-N(6)/adenine(1519)-N(6))-dimethyltransferase RsmA [Clostridia bacterium]